MYSSNAMISNNLRIEIAVLQENVEAFKGRLAKFKIPVIMTNDISANIITSNINIVNRRNGNLSASQLNINNTIDLYLPYEHIFTYGEKIVPIGTRFLIAFVGANINDAKIIGRYDQSSSDLAAALSDYIIEIIKLDEREKTIKDKINIDIQTLTSNMNLQFDDIRNAMALSEQSLSAQIDNLRLDDESARNQLKESLENLINITKENFENQLNQAVAQINQTILDTDTRLTNGIEAAKTEFNSNIETAKEECNTKINNTSEELSESIENNKTYLLGLINQLQELINSIHYDNQEEINEINRKINEILSSIEQLNFEDQSIRQLIESTKSYLLSEDQNKFNEAKQYTDDSIETVNTKIDLVDSNLDEFKLTVEQIKQELIDSISNVSSSISQDAKTYTDAEIQKVNESITTAYTQADDDIKQSITDVNASLNDAVTDINTKIDESVSTINQSIANKDEAVREYIDSSSASTLQKINEISDSINGNISDLKTSFSDAISDSNTAINSQLNTAVDSLTEQIATGVLESQNYTDSAIDKLSDTINTDFASAQNSIEEVKNDLSNEVTALHSEIKETVTSSDEIMNLKIDNIESNLNAKIEALSKTVKDNYAELRRDLDALRSEFDTYVEETDDFATNISADVHDIMVRLGMATDDD